MDFRPTPEQEMLRDAVAKVAAGFGRTYYQQHVAAGQKVDELWSALGQAGYLGVNVPAEYGGGGMGIAELAIVCEEVAAAGCPLLLLVVSPAICATIIAHFGAEEQKQAWLPRFGSG